MDMLLTPGLGWYVGGSSHPLDDRSLARALGAVHTPITIVGTADEGGLALADGGVAHLAFEADRATGPETRISAYAPPCPPAQLGSESFRRDHGLRFAYVA